MKTVKLTLAVLIASIGLSTAAFAQNADTGAVQKGTQASSTVTTTNGAGASSSMTEEQSDAMYDAARERCKALGTATTAKMHCIGIARAERNYREAQAEAQREQSAENRRDVLMAKAHLDYANAKAKCESTTSGQGKSTGVPASLCMAKANETKNKALAAAKVGVEKGMLGSKRGDIGREK